VSASYRIQQKLTSWTCF